MNKTTLKNISIGVGVLIAIVVIIMAMRSCKGGVGYLFKSTTVISVKHDTTVSYITQTDTQYIQVKGASIKETHSVKSHIDTFIQVVDNTGNIRIVQCNDDTVSYIDSIREKDDFKAVIQETITNSKRIKYNIEWANLTPIKLITDKETITKTKNALIKVYIGGDLIVSTRYTEVKTPVDIAPSLALIFSDKYMLDANYGIINQQPSIGFKIKISLKK